MELEVKNISIRKLDAYKESAFVIDQSKEIKNKEIKININLSLIDFKKTDDGHIIFKSSFALDMSDIGHIDAQIDTSVITDDQDTLLSEWNNSSTIKLPIEARAKLDTAIYYYLMPLFINITEKMQLPIPLTPLSTKTTKQ